MKKIFNAAKIFVTGIFLAGILFIGGKVSAAEVNQEAMQIFLETVEQTSKFDDRVFRHDIHFFVPQATAELGIYGTTEKDSLLVRGLFEFWMVDKDANYESVERPFYITQDKNNMVIYAQNDKKKWEKMTAPTSAANMVDMFATPDATQLAKMTEFVKDVTVLQDNDNSRTLLVKIDGAKILEEIKAEMAKDPEVQKQKDDEFSKMILGYFEDGFKNSDLWYMWTVDKTKWQTTTMNFNLSSLLQNIATSALNDTSNAFVSMEPIREILETVAYYSEFKVYTTFLNPAAKEKLQLPKQALKAKEVKSFNDNDKSKKK